MAKDPTAMIPFSEGTPDDGLQVEELPSGEVLVGAFPSVNDETESEFDQNLVEVIDQRDLNSAGSELIGYFESDSVIKMASKL